MPYQAMAMTARMSAGRLAPNTPNEMRAMTGNGAPVRCPANPVRFMRKNTITMPTTRATNTCHASSPRKNSPAANV